MYYCCCHLPQPTRRTLAYSSDALLRGHRHLRPHPNRTLYLPIRLDADDQPNGSTILFGGRLPVGFRYAGVRCGCTCFDSLGTCPDNILTYTLRPGTFDIYGSSHQLFHVLVVMATVLHLVGIFEAFDYNYYNRKCTAYH